MKKLAAFLLCVSMLSVGTLTAFAEETPEDVRKAGIVTTVPEEHMLTFKVYGNVEFRLDGEKGNEFRVKRLSEPLLEFIPKEGEKITDVTVNGEDVTGKLTDNKYQFAPITEDKEVIVEVKTETLPKPDPEPEPNPHTGVIGGVSIGSAGLLTVFAVSRRRSKESRKQ